MKYSHLHSKPYWLIIIALLVVAMWILTAPSPASSSNDWPSTINKGLINTEDKWLSKQDLLQLKIMQQLTSLGDKISEICPRSHAKVAIVMPFHSFDSVLNNMKRWRKKRFSPCDLKDPK